jgi:hypothetical protein
MKIQDGWQERRPEHGEQGLEVAVEDVLDRHLVVTMSFLHEAEESFEAVDAFDALDLQLHVGDVGAQSHVFAVCKVTKVCFENKRDQLPDALV